MKVTLEIEFEVEPEQELTARQEKNVTGMMRRLARRRLDALLGRRVGGEKAETGWEVTVKAVEVEAPSKVR